MVWYRNAPFRLKGGVCTVPERILVVDDEESCREGLRRLLEAWGYEADTAASAEAALELLESRNPSAILTDLVLPGGMDGIELVRRLKNHYPVPVIVLSGQGTIENAVEAVKLGAQDFLEKPVEPAKLQLLLERMADMRELLADNRRLRAELRDRGQFGSLRGISSGMKQVFHEIEKVAPSKLAVLVVGESGTGKELVARTVHDLSPRRRGEFLALNCAAIPSTLLESEIFGHERGAFTGALQRKIGCFEMADGGTLFLDEVSEMDLGVQAKLLRVLQDQHFRRVGGRDLIEADVRVVAATNRDPKVAIADGKLREDLFYRLAGFTIVIPPLRGRVEDIPVLARHLSESYAERTATEASALSADALDSLIRYPWPGNVRELKNCIERATVMAGGGTIRREHLAPEVRDYREPVDADAAPQPPVVVEAAPDLGGPGRVPDIVSVPLGSSMEQAEREVIRSTLQHTAGNKTRAARILGVSLKTMHNKVKKYRL